MAAEVVLITDTGDEVWLAGGNLDQSGTVTFRHLRAGDRVVARPVVPARSLFEVPAPAPMVLVAGDNRSDLQLDEVPRAVLDGTVRYSNGDPVTVGEVTVTQQYRGFSQTFTSSLDGDGTYRIEALPGEAQVAVGAGMMGPEERRVGTEGGREGRD